MIWPPDDFLIATTSGVQEVTGYTNQGLGLHIAVKGSPKGKRPPTWALIHLGSGHAVCRIEGTVKDVFPVASEIAELGDWTFDGLYGWKNSDPELRQKLKKLMASNRVKITGYRGMSSQHIARQIALARA